MNEIKKYNYAPYLTAMAILAHRPAFQDGGLIFKIW